MDRFYAWLAELARAGRLPAPFEYAFVVRGILAVILLAPLLGGMSHIVVTRRLAFLSTALGQAALTGLTIGLVLGEPISAPYGGMLGFCLLAALLMVFAKRRSGLPPDTLIGVFMALTLGLGICLLVAVTQQFNVHQIEAVMFGSLLTVTDADLAILLLVGVAAALVMARIYNRLLLDSLSPPLGRAARVDSTLLDNLFVLLLTVAIVVSLKIVGALLVEAMVVVPAAAARNVTRTTRGYVAASIAVSLLSGLAGIGVSTAWRVPTGGAVVLALSAAFFLTLAASAVRGAIHADR